ncbi:hypothetical protein PG999_010243 [Apiospora kogelbergensis]|uniref:Uncharacterized protein n=1 Tax=Apiospora kogelbergensis TaxID=1337665 RepID=A0AAW0QJH0_9PEZI
MACGAADHNATRFPGLPKIPWISELVVYVWTPCLIAAATALWMMGSVSPSCKKQLVVSLGPGEQFASHCYFSLVVIDGMNLADEPIDFTPLAADSMRASARGMILEINRDDKHLSDEARKSAPVSLALGLHKFSQGLRSLTINKGVQATIEIFYNHLTDGSTPERPFLETLVMDYAQCVAKVTEPPSHAGQGSGIGSNAKQQAREMVWEAVATTAQKAPQLRSVRLFSASSANPCLLFGCKTAQPGEPSTRLLLQAAGSTDGLETPSTRVLQAWLAVTRIRQTHGLKVILLNFVAQSAVFIVFRTSHEPPDVFVVPRRSGGIQPLGRET